MIEWLSQHDKRAGGVTQAQNVHVWQTFGVLFLLAVVLAFGAAGCAARRGDDAAEPARKEESVEAVEDTAPDPEPEPEPEPEPVEPVNIKLMMIGDILMHDGVIHSGDQEDGSLNFDHLFAHISEDIAEADVAVVNQETILGDASWGYSGYPNFNSPQEVGDAEVAAGFDVILKATNHTLDMGYDGVRSELAFWRDNHPEMAVIGAADPDGDGNAPAGGTSPAGPYIYEKDGFRVALLNYTDILNSNVDVDHDPRVVSVMDEELIRNEVAEAHKAADLVIVFAHWGEEYETSPSEDERYWAGVLYDAGVDVVIGGHPHVIQPVEVMGEEGARKMLICWSVGNFVSTQLGAANMVGGLVKLDLVKDAEGARVSSYEFVPVITQYAPYRIDETTYRLRDYTDELAANNGVSNYDYGNGSTVDWYRSFCAEVLGEAFDQETASVHGSL